MHMVMQLEFFAALQSEDIATLYPPAEPYEEFLSRMPRRRTPSPDDLYARWDLQNYKCLNAKCSLKVAGTLTVGGGRCTECGTALAPAGPVGVGERRAYLGWLTGIMEKEESNFFWMTVVANHPDALLMFAVVPFVKQLTGEVARLKRDLDDGLSRIKALTAEVRDAKASR